MTSSGWRRARSTTDPRSPSTITTWPSRRSSRPSTPGLRARTRGRTGNPNPGAVRPVDPTSRARTAADSRPSRSAARASLAWSGPLTTTASRADPAAASNAASKPSSTSTRSNSVPSTPSMPARCSVPALDRASSRARTSASTRAPSVRASASAATTRSQAAFRPMAASWARASAEAMPATSGSSADSPTDRSALRLSASSSSRANAVSVPSSRTVRRSRSPPACATAARSTPNSPRDSAAYPPRGRTPSDQAISNEARSAASSVWARARRSASGARRSASASSSSNFSSERSSSASRPTTTCWETNVERSRSIPLSRSTSTARRPRPRSRRASRRTNLSPRSSPPRVASSASAAVTSASKRARAAVWVDWSALRTVRRPASSRAFVLRAVNSLPARCSRSAVSSSTRSPWRRAASACRSRGRTCRRTSRRRSDNRSRLASVDRRRRWAFSLRRRYFRIPAASSMIIRRSSGRAFRTASIWPWEMMTCCWRPTPTSESTSWMSSSRQGAPFIEYSLSPLRNSVRAMVTSPNSTGSSPDELSMVRETSARPRAARVAVPAKMTSSIFWDRTELGAWAPSTHAMASTTLDLPLPFGPTRTVTPGSISSVAVSANDLKPLMDSRFRNTSAHASTSPELHGCHSPCAPP